MMHKTNDTLKKTILISIIGFFITLFPTTIKAQLFNGNYFNELYQNVISIKGKHFNGTGGRGGYSLLYVDSLGRVIENERYRRKHLLWRQKFIYDNYNNWIFDTHTSDINNQDQITTSKYKYIYARNQIIYQCHFLRNNDSIVTKLTKNEGDTILKYQEKAYYFRPTTGKTAVYENEYILRYKDGLLISNCIINKEDNSKEITTFEYYDNGRLKRRLIKRIPKPKQESFYSGGPGSDDEYYKYKLDAKGRVRKFYRIINDKRYKIATYRYNEK